SASRENGIDDSGHRNAADDQTIACEALELRAGFLRDATARNVVGGGDDLDSREPQRLESEAGEAAHRRNGDSMSLPRLTHPIAEIRQVVVAAQSSGASSSR